MMINLFRIGSLFLSAVLFSCDSGINDTDNAIPEDINFPVPDWTEATHGKSNDPDYSIVFNQTQVNSVEIVMTASDWTTIREDMVEKIGYTFGSGNVTTAGPGGFTSEDPVYVPVSLKFNGIEWYKVGFRLKGNSSLSSSWRAGIYKLPFRLKFDEYEDTYPQITDQRFYGFKELSMSPGAKDNSLIREKVGADIFRMAGIPAAQTSFYAVSIDFGEGLTYCGVYTMVEVIDDTMVDHFYGAATGNIYKPESTFKSFSASEFEKKNNEAENDYSDVENTIALLNSTLRTTNAPQWRSSLEDLFNVDHFVKWLAVNNTIENWDTYGNMAHNYYLYNDQDKGLTWIPWDHNESLTSTGRNALSLPLSGITGNWPLIRYVIDDPVYLEAYKAYVEEFTGNTFTTEKMNALFEYHHNLISPYVSGPLGIEQGKYTQLSATSAFPGTLSELKQHVTKRRQAVDEYLN